MMNNGKIVVKEGKGKKYYVVVIGANNKVLMTSELLNSKASARKNIMAAHNAFKCGKWVNLTSDKK